MSAVTMWAYDFETSNLPPVCAISGRPAECWERFRVRGTPAKAVAPIAGATAAGILVGGAAGFLAPLIEDAVALRAKGYLPLTRWMRRFVRLGRVVPGLALAAGLLVAVAGVGIQSGVLGGAGFITFLLAIPVGAIVNWRLEPHGTLRRSNGTLVLKLSNVHPNFVAAEEQSLREALEQGSWPPGFLGPALVPLRFRDPLATLVGRIVDGDVRELIEAGYLLDPSSRTVEIEELSESLVPLPSAAWEVARCGKFVQNPGVWWVIVPLWTLDGPSDLLLEATLRETGDQIDWQVALSA
jgi:hypothetical protein